VAVEEEVSVVVALPPTQAALIAVNLIMNIVHIILIQCIKKPMLAQDGGKLEISLKQLISGSGYETICFSMELTITNSAKHLTSSASMRQI
jgi:hypothetical protein